MPPHSHTRVAEPPSVGPKVFLSMERKTRLRPPNGSKSAEAGFTLAEVMVVVLIIGLLLGIAIPTFLGARERAQDRAAESSIRVAEVTARTLLTDQLAFTGAVAEFAAAEPSLDWIDGPSTSSQQVSVLGSPSSVSAAVRSDSGRCFQVLVVAVGPTSAFSSEPTSCEALQSSTASTSGSATVTGGFEFDADGFAGTTNTFACCGGSDAGEITYTLAVPETGDYKLLGTVKAFQGNTDSFWVLTSLDGFGARYLWDVSWGNPTTDFVNNRGSGDVVLSIPAGTILTVKVQVREDGTFIGGIELVAV